MRSEVYTYQGSPVTFGLNNAAAMINATEMAKPFGKRPADWLRLPSTKDFTTALCEVRKSDITQLVKTFKGNSAEFEQGTWMHEDVALEFARWLSPAFAIWCNDRIKELMQYGITATPQTIQSILSDPDNAILLLTELKQGREQLAKANQKIEVLEGVVTDYKKLNNDLIDAVYERDNTIEQQAPLVRYAENVLQSDTTYTSTQIGKELGMSAAGLNKMLHAFGIIFRQGGQWFPYSKYQDKGLMKIREYVFQRPDGQSDLRYSTVWTTSGRMFVLDLVRRKMNRYPRLNLQ